MSEIELKAVAKNIRISPRKVAVVTDLVRRRSVSDALTILEHTERKAAGPVIKLINSAVANGKNNLRLSNDILQSLDIKTIMVTEGSTMKRYKFVGTGRRARPRPMLKRSSHITVVLSATAPEEKKEAKKPAVSKAPVKSEVKKVVSKKETKK
jgi:large subunit ribosomal protein L22